MVTVTYEHLDSFTKRNIMFVLVFVFFATLGSIWGPFHIPAITVLLLWSFFISQQLRIASKFTI